MPETASECPKCGIEFEVDVAKCSVCESWIKSNAEVCPYCNTPFKALEGVDEEGKGGPTPPEEGEAGTLDGSEDVEVTIDEGPDMGVVEVPPEALKRVPEGIKKEVRPRPVVSKKALKEVPKETPLEPENGNEVGTNGPVRPRVKKVASRTMEEQPSGPSEWTETEDTEGG